MITRNDCVLLLCDLETNGVDCVEQKKALLNSRDLPISVVEFINQHRPFEISKFYEKLRKSYNAKHSQLYGNIVKEITDVKEVLTTLSALNTQILLFSDKIEDSELFLKHARFSEICNCLSSYATTYNINPCIQLLRLVKSDLKAFESMKP